MSEAIDREKMFWQNDPFLCRFSFQFSKKVRTNPMYHTVYRMIADPNISEYQIIEELLKMNENLSNAVVKLQEEQKPKYFMVDEKK